MSETATMLTEGEAASSEATETAATAAAEGGQQQTTETAATAAAEGGQQQQQEQSQGAPEKYEFNGEFDSGVIGAFSDVAKELNLPQDSAQKILDKMSPVLQARQTEQLAAVSAQWADAAKSDKEFGGDKLAENLGVAKKALDEFASPELRTLLDQSGLGNHPEVIRMFYRAGKAISEDGFVAGRKTAGGPSDPAKRLFPNQQ